MILVVLPGAEQVNSLLASEQGPPKAVLQLMVFNDSYIWSLRSKGLGLWEERERITACPAAWGIRRPLQVKALKTQLLCPGLHQWVVPKPLRATGNVMWKMLSSKSNYARNTINRHPFPRKSVIPSTAVNPTSLKEPWKIL